MSPLIRSGQLDRSTDRSVAPCCRAALTQEVTKCMSPLNLTLVEKTKDGRSNIPAPRPRPSPKLRTDGLLLKDQPFFSLLGFTKLHNKTYPWHLFN